MEIWILDLNIKPSVWDRMERENLSYSFDVLAGDSVASVTVSVNGTQFQAVNVAVSQSGAPTRNQTLPVENGSRESVLFKYESLVNYVDLQVQVRAQSRADQSWTSYVSYGAPLYPSTWITPEVVSKFYNIPPNYRATNRTNTQVSFF